MLNATLLRCARAHDTGKTKQVKSDNTVLPRHITLYQLKSAHMRNQPWLYLGLSVFTEALVFSEASKE
ncbi:hypothetical protein C3Y98_05935 [Methylotenera oryzisoli]|uniref:Uncharacterized protein n=1 Tax=Methylotenera oryzisoli TaxID=2080758 RepID=A0A4Y9VR84_9PROT|nr:hypothetical protein C3Y98_05935 [Methylotenera oryzisoli]